MDDQERRSVWHRLIPLQGVVIYAALVGLLMVVINALIFRYAPTQAVSTWLHPLADVLIVISSTAMAYFLLRRSFRTLERTEQAVSTKKPEHHQVFERNQAVQLLI